MPRPVAKSLDQTVLTDKDGIQSTNSNPRQVIHNNKVYSCYGKRYEKINARQRLKSGGQALWDISIGILFGGIPLLFKGYRTRVATELSEVAFGKQKVYHYKNVSDPDSTTEKVKSKFPENN